VTLFGTSTPAPFPEWQFTFLNNCFKVLLCVNLGLNFTNVLLKFFSHSDPKSTKRHWSLNCLFAILGSACLKAVLKHDGEIQFHQRFLRAFFVWIFGAKLGFSLAPKIRTKNERKKRWWNWLQVFNSNIFTGYRD